MISPWPRRPISELCVEIVDCVNKTAPTVQGPTPFRMIRTTNVKGGFVDLSEVRYVEEATYRQWTRRQVPRRGDVILTREAPLGQAGLVRDDEGIFLGQRLMSYRPNPKCLDQRFLLYSLLSPDLQGQIQALGAGSTVAHMRVPDAERLLVPTPPHAIQERIGSILGTFDDLIEVNRRRIARLEEMARRLFEEWFVHFRFPGHEDSAMRDGQPAEWQRLTLGEVAEVRLGKMLDAAKNRGELRPYLANVNVRWGSIDLSELRAMRFEPDEAEKYGLAYGDIVMCEGGEPGRCAMWKGEAAQMMLQKALHRIRARKNMDRNYLFHYLLFTARSQQLSGLFTGSTIKHLPREKLLSLRVTMPSGDLLERFGRLVTPIEGQIGTLQAAIRQLHEMRDILLPRLISGELPVSTAELELEVAA
ncbi:restriction endonuclease subunit S [Methylorubrum aminovorans]|uniref:restriction endonuclease subunit S n=1 Tax=Methylorubrum aminovorans TaxID=269069 RepID=UPI003C3022F1